MTANDIAGVDGCRRGWVVAIRHTRKDTATVWNSTVAVSALARTVDVGGDRSSRLTVGLVERIGPLVAEVEQGRLAALAVDMPIGLPTDGPRACDRAARRRLGRRRSSVFPTPARCLLGIDDYGEALARSRAACGRGLSREAFNLLGKLAEVDAAMQPALQDRVVEAHPELAFARLGGRPAVHPKRSAAGRAERARLLEAAGLGGLSIAALRLPGAAPDDVLDAVVLTLTAARVRDGTAEHLGDGSCDARGLRMEIVV